MGTIDKPTDEDAKGRALFQKWCDEANLSMGIDKMGTMFARREGTDPDALTSICRKPFRYPTHWWKI